MSDEPLFDPGVPYSINRFAGNGSQTVFELNFSGGYLLQSNVKAYKTAANGTVTLITPLTFLGPTTISISPPLPVGTTLTVYRDTGKGVPAVDFSDGSIINERNLDMIARQSVFAAAEMYDRFALTVTKADAALANSLFAIETASTLTGGDFSQFVLLSNLTWSAISGKPATFAPSAHTHTIGDITGLQAALDGKITTADLASGLATRTTPVDVATAANNAVATAAATTLTETNARKASDAFLFAWASR